jgi:hypothetical protein
MAVRFHTGPARVITRRMVIAPASDPSLGDVVPSACCDLDVTLADSYAGSGQTWGNLVPTPADGAAKTDYDVFLGSDNTGPATDDPTFTGTAGSPSAYWSVDGADWFMNKLTNTGQPRTLRYLHRTDDTSGWWCAWAFRQAPSPGPFTGLLANGDESNNGGMTVFFSGAALIARSIGSQVSFIQAFATSTDYLIIVSANAARTQFRAWVNTASADQQNQSFAAATADPPRSTKLFTAFDTAFPIASGGRLYSFACGNSYLDNTEAAAIISKLETRHGRDYTP